MNEIQLKEEFEQEILALALKYSVNKLKIATLNFEYEYARESDGSFALKKQKALVQSYGRVTKVPFGEGEEFLTYEEARDATKKHWSNYYKKARLALTPEQKATYAMRQRQYREKYKAEGASR